MTITGGTALAQNDIDRMVRDAEAHAADDAERKEAAEARNQADHAAYQIDKQLAEHGDKLTADERHAIESALGTVRSQLDDTGATAASLQAATETLLTASQYFGQRIYEASQAAETPVESAPEGNDDIVEAEIVEDEAA